MTKQKQIWVHPEFAKVLKANASIQGIKIVDYTKRLSEQLNVNYEEQRQQKKNEKYWFKF